MKVRPVFDNPLLYLNAYGLGNPWVVWALERGLLDDWCPSCRGEGVVIDSPCPCRESVDKETCAGGCSLTDGCGCCRSRCRSCAGSKLRADRPLCAQDFGDQADIAKAHAMFPTLMARAERRPEFHERQLR